MWSPVGANTALTRTVGVEHTLYLSLQQAGHPTPQVQFTLDHEQSDSGSPIPISHPTSRKL